ncbi:MAG: hypothetical protein K8R69_11560 [Deltaproteobacteria bacterium]|nr:hypothetical protein [Deltaproteobacteria bacterium]
MPIWKYLRVIPAFFTLFACATGPGNFDDEPGSANLSLQLSGLESSTPVVSHDGFILTFTHFALSFSQMQLGEASVEEAFSADIFSETASGLAVLEDMAPGDYSSLALTLGMTGNPPLQGNSILLEGEARKGGSKCVLNVQLQADGTALEVDAGDEGVSVVSGEETQLLVQVDPNAVFAGVDLGGLCQNGATVMISAAQNSQLAEQILGNFSSAFSL